MIFDKGTNQRLSKHFSSSEFDCHCKYPSCTTTQVDENLLDALDHLRDIVGPLQINSGYRCVKHNADVGGVGGSQHCNGLAADVQSLNGLSGAELAKYILQVPLLNKGGLGVAPNWCHTDVRGNGRARWTYPALN